MLSNLHLHLYRHLDSGDALIEGVLKAADEVDPCLQNSTSAVIYSGEHSSQLCFINLAFFPPSQTPLLTFVHTCSVWLRRAISQMRSLVITTGRSDVHLNDDLQIRLYQSLDRCRWKCLPCWQTPTHKAEDSMPTGTCIVDFVRGGGGNSFLMFALARLTAMKCRQMLHENIDQPLHAEHVFWVQVITLNRLF